ncbi:MAG: hypothetical protein [Siphoviridae sp. ctCJE6]|nr:MAG: hypothetical protein [Siphoviridae sp. ctCJE6]
MAKNFKYSGKRITVKSLSAAVAAGNLVRQKGFVGIPLSHAPSGGSVAFALEGVWGMTYGDYAGLDGVTLAVGTILYWDTSAGKLSMGYANDDYPAVKCVTAVSASDGSFDGLLLPQTKPVGQEQS